MDSFVEIAQPSTLHVVSGNMRGGKTLEFLTRMNLVSYRGIPWQLFKPSADDGRDLCTADQIGSRGLFDATISVDATVINEEEPATILDNLNIEPYGIIGIEEVHFFKKPDALVATVLELRRRGYSILVCGLDRDFRGEPFQPTPTLMAHATTIRKYFAACTFLEDGEPCGDKAEYSQRLINGEPAPYGDDLIVVGNEDYVPRCMEHHFVPGKPKFKR